MKSHSLPRDMFVTIFGFFRPEELPQYARVCRKWQEFVSDTLLWDAYDLKKLYPGFNDLRGIWDRIGPAYGLSSEGVLSLDNRTLTPVVSRMSRFVEEGAGVTVFIVPKGCSLSKILQVAKDHGVPVNHYWPRAIRELGKIETSDAKVVVMTNSILAGSRCRFVADQQAILQRIGCSMPDVVSAVTLLVLTLISSPEKARERLYAEAPLTVIRCLEGVDIFRLVVGSFFPSGFDLNCNYYDFEGIGIGCLWKF